MWQVSGWGSPPKGVALRNIFDPKIMRGMLIGFAVGTIVTTGLQMMGVALSLTRGMFWGAVIGGFVVYWPRFAQLGAVITRKPRERNRNMVVGILSLLVFAALVMLIIVAGGALLARCYPDF